jgi:hypothetical protein
MASETKVKRYAWQCGRYNKDVPCESFEIAHGAFVRHTEHVAAIRAAEIRGAKAMLNFLAAAYRDPKQGLEDLASMDPAAIIEAAKREETERGE